MFFLPAFGQKLFSQKKQQKQASPWQGSIPVCLSFIRNPRERVLLRKIAVCVWCIPESLQRADSLCLPAVSISIVVGWKDCGLHLCRWQLGRLSLCSTTMPSLSTHTQLRATRKPALSNPKSAFSRQRPKKGKSWGSE